MMDNKNLSENLKGLKIDDDKEINILLLGQSGIGKSTLINSVINYMSFKEFLQAEHKLDKLSVLIPSQFGISNKDNEMEEVRIRETEADDDDDKNEHIEIGESATQDVKSYLFTVPIGNYKMKVKLVDSPGIGDSRGLIQDAENIDKILSYIGQLDEIHAICLVFNPTNTRITAFFEYCLQEILSRLNKSASKNLVFIFTSTKGTNFTPGDTFPLLRKIRDKIRAKNDVDILLDQNENVFCFENDAFKYLAAMKQGVAFSKEQRREYLRSWNQSCKECLRLISYIVGDEKRPPLAPHSTQGTISINEARRLITNLSQPLADISQLIQDNINVLQRHQHNLSVEEHSINDLKKRLYIPVIDLKVTELRQPVTVCTSSKCTENIFVESVKLKHYKQRCHDPCYLVGIPKEIVGDAGLVNCYCIDRSTKSCRMCTCDFSIHMHVYYLTEPVNEKKEDKVVKRDIVNREEAVRSKNALIAQIEQRRREYEKERERIVVCAAQFAHFLQHNAITPINDCYETYIKYLIRREEGLGRYADQETLDQLNNMLARYKETKQTFDKSLELQRQMGDGSSPSFVDAETIKRTIQNLYQLRHTGAKIEELVEKQMASRKTEHNFLCKTVDLKQSVDAKKTKKVDATVSGKGDETETGKTSDAGNKQQYKKKPFDPKKANGPNKQKFNPRPRDHSNHRTRDHSSHRESNYGPPPPYEHVQSQQLPPFPPQQPVYHQPHFQPSPSVQYCGNTHGYGHGQAIEVKINQNPCRDPHCHQCTNLPQPPPQTGYVGPQTGYTGPYSGYPASQSGYPGPQYPGPQYHGPQSGYSGPQSGYAATGGPHGQQSGGFADNQGHQQQNRQGFNYQNKQNRNQNNYPQGGSGGGPKFNYNRPQNRSDDNRARPKYQNDNRNQKFDGNNKNQSGGGPQNKPNKEGGRPNNQQNQQNQQRPNKKTGGNSNQGNGEDNSECVIF